MKRIQACIEHFSITVDEKTLAVDSSWWRLICCLLLVMILPGGFGTEAKAQYGEDRQITQQRERGQRKAERLPSWARPMNHNSREPTGSVSESNVRAKATPGRPVPNPENVPIGGGLGWLLAAGAGYGTYRLRSSGGSAQKDDR